MSMTFGVIKCDKCDFHTTTMVAWGGFFYRFPDGDLLWINRDMGWCYDCKTIQSIEILPSEGLQSKLNYMEYNLRKLMGWGILGVYREKYGKQKYEIMMLRDLIADHKKYMEMTSLRNSPAKCLDCGSTKINRIEMPSFYDTKVAQGINFRHPDCNGELLINESDMRISKSMPRRYYSLEGDFIEECEPESHYHFYGKNPRKHPIEILQRLYFG